MYFHDYLVYVIALPIILVISIACRIKIIQVYYVIVSYWIIILSSHYFYYQVTFNAQAPLY